MQWWSECAMGRLRPRRRRGRGPVRGLRDTERLGGPQQLRDRRRGRHAGAGLAGRGGFRHELAVYVQLEIASGSNDGIGTTGTVRGLKQTAPNPAIPAAGLASAYTEDGVSTYVVCRTM